MLISLSITLPQSPYLHREQRLQPTKKLLRDTEGNKRFRFPPFLNQVRSLNNKREARFASRHRHLVRRRVRYAHVSCFYFPTHPHQKHDMVANHDGHNGRNRLRRFRIALERRELRTGNGFKNGQKNQRNGHTRNERKDLTIDSIDST